ncbi:Trp biosynthesis-associated membrane protein [Microbacterium rhizomatis]|uniref:Trp biosynthesis-associated membrane protein n=1 Tax=Microbacterium rhizomatis TaxID=1631477 RepID=A0A5J5J6H9_9MICO|nr:Trp biosynthesis-associated membrane protein [Microbacterium rhizomatis]KAA9110585.1 Trp biosynthesis-associated membrane protein [Microbacterium rhizomatis]
MLSRARLLAVVVTIAAGALGVISSTQTWLVVTLADGADHTVDVAGAAAIPVLAPLSLATLALGAALSIVGLVLRWVFGVLTVVIAVALGILTATTVLATPVSAYATSVTSTTGITGTDAVAALVSSTQATAWPYVTLIVWVVLLAAGIMTLVTATRWRGSGRRYRTEGGGRAAASRPRDAIDSWDDLSRGSDPTA